MVSSKLRRRLSAMDAFFLYLEREEAPMSVGCIAVFEGRISTKKFIANLAARLQHIPRYLQKVVPAPLNLGHPTWEFDPDFDIHNHVIEIKIPPPGTEVELRNLGARLFEKPLSREKPLWEIYIIQGLENKKTALLTKIHHCMVDGISGIDLMFAIFDTTPDPPRHAKAPYTPAPAPPLLSRLYDVLWDNAIEGLDHWTRFQRDLVDYGQGADPHYVIESLREFAATMIGFLSPIKRLPFNKAFSGARKIVWGEFSFAEARAIRSVCGGTFNDVVLTILSSAVRRYAEMLGETPSDHDLRFLVPVNIRKEDERGALGNRITFLPVQIPLNIHDPIERLRLLNETTQSLKKKRVPEAISMMFSALQGAYAPVQASVVQTAAAPLGRSLLSMLSQVPPLHMICTNVPGPQIPLYTVGHELLGYYPLVPVALDMGVSCGVTTYNQKMCVCFTADANAAPDVDKLMELFSEEFLALRVRAEVEEKVRVEISRVVRESKSKLDEASASRPHKRANKRKKIEA